MTRFFLLPFILLLPSGSWALKLGAPKPKDTLSTTIFTGGALSLSWIANASDPPLFDLTLVGELDDMMLFPGVRSEDTPWELHVTYRAQNYFFRAVDHSTGRPLAESGVFQITSVPQIDMSNGSPTTGVVAIPQMTMSETMAMATVHPRSHRRILIGAIVGGVLGAVILVAAVAVFVWRWRIRKRAAGRPMIIDDDARSKAESEITSFLPVHARVLSPFRIQPAPATMPPLGLTRLEPANVFELQVTLLGSPSFQDAAAAPEIATSPPTVQAAKHTRVSHHRKLSYDIPAQTPRSSKPSHNRHSSYFPHERRVVPTPRLQEMQVELETAVSETLYDNEKQEEESEMPLKPPPTRRRPLRTRSEPRPLSSEFGSTDGHDLSTQPSVDGSGSLQNAVSTEPEATGGVTIR
ncbi:hypothetical protein C8R46DRAFT_1198503 [Mycena filopes]|nr:hypothetical protein C8R46DRAFT_1198503 [Mycena filopes]